MSKRRPSAPPPKPKPSQAQSSKAQSSKAPPPKAPARKAQREAQERRKRQRKTVVLALASAGALALTVLLVVAVGNSVKKDPTPSAPPITGVHTFDPQPNRHVEGEVDYPHTPPVGGDHLPVFQNCGYYSVPVLKETAVHSMEHGAVWITYQPDLPADQVAILRDLARRQADVLVSPWPSKVLPGPVVTSAWRRQMVSESATDPRIEQFVEQYRRSDLAPEASSACQGGFGTPQ